MNPVCPMKVVISHAVPFSLAHGGSQTLIESLSAALRRIGVDIEPERWWDETQSCDILHYVGRPLGLTVRLAKDKGRKIVMTELLDSTASRPRTQLWIQRQMIVTARLMLGHLTGRLGWDAYPLIDAFVYATPLEWEVAKYLFDAPPDRGWIVPHGLEDRALEELSAPQAEEDYLISVATIHPRKNQIALVHAARRSGVPIVFLGKPYSDADTYFRRFLAMADGKLIRYAGFVPEDEKLRWLRGARGFVLLSEFESGCIAVYEAAAAGLPLLLAARPWATRGYPPSDRIRFARLDSRRRLAKDLAAFYASAHRGGGQTFPVLSWDAIASKYLDVYERILRKPGTS